MPARSIDAFSTDEQGTGFGLLPTVSMFCGVIGRSSPMPSPGQRKGNLPTDGSKPLALGIAALASNHLLDLGI